jgi:hypothetical protein
MIGMNVMLIIDGVFSAGNVADDMDSQSGCTAACLPWENPEYRSVNP